ncbi:MAG: hypothetical protein DIJKHBIC_00281 [Thermoanaerobaculia bacterium]|nr:hypothetical protein [Thermoanaerobaculia bacterium]
MVSHPRHEFLERLPSLAGADFEVHARRLQGHQQVTDAYLSFLASESQARLVTFDTRLSVIAPSQEAVQVLLP